MLTKGKNCEVGTVWKGKFAKVDWERIENTVVEKRKNWSVDGELVKGQVSQRRKAQRHAKLLLV